MKKLFDENGMLLLDEIVFQSQSYQSIIEDKVVTEDEIIGQANRIVQLLKKIDDQLNTADKELVVDTISELAVLYQINALKGGNSYGNL